MTSGFFIQEDVIAIFDFTYSYEAKQTLHTIFLNNLPLAGILERQQLLRTFIDNWEMLGNFFYHKAEMQEVLRFTSSLNNHNWENAGGLYNLFFKKEKYTIRSQSIQTIIFLNNLYTYFRNAGSIIYPASFQRKLNAVTELFLSLDIFTLNKDIQNNTFTFGKAINFVKDISKKYAGMFESFWTSLFEYEAYWSISRSIIAHSFTFPVFEDDHFSLVKFYHPLINDPVKNNLIVDKNLLILTGPNMSGKSTLLKSLNLCVLLSHIGLAVPAKSCRIPFYDYMFFSININDDIKKGNSSFMNEVIGLKQVILKLTEGKRCFALFDELFKGTNIDDAVDLMHITINGLLQFKGSLFIISTHLHQMIVNENIDTYQLEAKVEDGRPTQTFRLIKGWSHLKFGKLLFEREGLMHLLAYNQPYRKL